VRRIFRPKGEKVERGWRRLHDKELHNLYASPNIIREIMSRRMRWEGYVACMADMRNAHKILVGIREGKRPVARPKRRWEDNIRLDLGAVGW
jgi:hypothetical protein